MSARPDSACTSHTRPLHHRLPVHIAPSAQSASQAVADEIAALLRARAATGRKAVLGLSTGSTPLGVYRELARLHREDALSFANVITFNLDEYYPMPASHAASYTSYMRRNLFDLVDIPPHAWHLPPGDCPPQDLPATCTRYEQQIQEAGGLDLLLLGIGRTGHIAFNEPGSSPHTLTRLVSLHPITRQDAAKDFSDLQHVPQHAVTMGIRTVLNAKRILLLALGEHKAEVIRKALQDAPHEQLPATFLQQHGNVLFMLDPAAASQLTPAQ